MCCCCCCCFFWLEVKKEVEEAEKKSAEEEEEEEDEEEEVYRCGFYLVVWVIWKLFPQKLKLERWKVGGLVRPRIPPSFNGFS